MKLSGRRVIRLPTLRFAVAAIASFTSTMCSAINSPYLDRKIDGYFPDPEVNAAARCILKYRDTFTSHCKTDRRILTYEYLNYDDDWVRKEPFSFDIPGLFYALEARTGVVKFKPEMMQEFLKAGVSCDRLDGTALSNDWVDSMNNPDLKNPVSMKYLKALVAGGCHPNTILTFDVHLPVNGFVDDDGIVRDISEYVDGDKGKFSPLSHEIVEEMRFKDRMDKLMFHAKMKYLVSIGTDFEIKNDIGSGAFGNALPSYLSDSEPFEKIHALLDYGLKPTGYDRRGVGICYHLHHATDSLWDNGRVNENYDWNENKRLRQELSIRLKNEFGLDCKYDGTVKPFPEEVNYGNERGPLPF